MTDKRCCGLTDVKVHQTPLSLSSPVSVGRDIERSKGVGFFSVVGLVQHDEYVSYRRNMTSPTSNQAHGHTIVTDDEAKVLAEMVA